MNIPLIIFHGINDRVIRAETVKMFYDNITNNSKELVMVQDGSHCLFNDTVFEDYFEKLSTFVLSRLK